MESIALRVLRREAGGAAPRWAAYVVPHFEERMTVLDALFWVRHHLEPTLAFRCACRVGMCGTCGMVINGTEGLACRTLVATVGPRVRLEPLRSLPVLRDLAVDLGPFFEQYRRVGAAFVPADGSQDPARIPPGSKARERIDLHRECISCGLCYSACDVVALHPGYLGPAALNRAYCLVADPREGARAERLDRVATEEGLWRCHSLFSCTQVCPKGIAPSHAIALLKRKVVRRRLLRLLPWRR